MRRCKVCRKKKERVVFATGPDSRIVYRDAGGSTWHGKTCGPCNTLKVKEKSLKSPLCPGLCVVCGANFNRRVINKIVCGKECYRVLRSRRRQC